MSEAMDTQVQTEDILPSSEVEKYLHKDVQKEAALAAMAANYDHQRFKDLDTYDGEFAKYFKVIKDKEGKAKFTKETLETAKALQPAIDYYVKVLPNELLNLPFFSDKNESAHSAHFGSLPSVEESDFRRALYRLQAICEVTRQSNGRERVNIMRQYHHDRDKVSPYSSMELSQANLLYELLFYRMFQICDKLFDSMEKKECRPDPVARKPREKKIVHGIVCQGLQFMYEFETQSTDGVREELIQKIGKGHWVRPRFWRDRGQLESRTTQVQEELCAFQRIFDNKHGYIPRDCHYGPCRECHYYIELPRPTRQRPTRRTLREVGERILAHLEKMKKKQLGRPPQVPGEETEAGHIHPASDN